MASFYGEVTYNPANAIMFRINGMSPYNSLYLTD